MKSEHDDIEVIVTIGHPDEVNIDEVVEIIGDDIHKVAEAIAQKLYEELAKESKQRRSK